MQLKRFDTLDPCRADHGRLLLRLRSIHQRLAGASLPGWASLLAEIDARPTHNLPGSVDDELKPSIAIVERQPMKPHIRANALLADGSDLAGSHPQRVGPALSLSARLLASALLLAPAARADTAQPPMAEILDSVRVPAAGPDGSEISELSGLTWDEDEQLLYAVSDSGFLIHFRIAIENDKLAKVEPVLVAPIAEFVGSLLKLTWSLSNAEGVLARNNANGKRSDTELIVALEDGPAIGRFTPQGQFIKEIALPPPLGDPGVYSSSNKRLESVNEIPGHGIITAPEVPLLAEPEDVHTIYAADGATWRFKALQPHHSSIKDIEHLPDGRLLILERTCDEAGYNPEAHLRVLNIEACETGSLCPVTEVAVSDTGLAENGL